MPTVTTCSARSIGILLFTLCSFFGYPPIIWFLFSSILFVVLLGGARRLVSIALLVATTPFSPIPMSKPRGVFWSPYYRVTTFEEADGRGGTQWQVYVNGIPHQRLTTAATRLAQEPFYDEPYRRVSTPPKTC